MTPDPYAQDTIPLPRLRTISHLWSCAALLAGVGVAVLAIDVPLAQLVRDGRVPGVLEKICRLSEIFSNGLGVVLIVAAIGVLDPWHRYGIPRMMAAALGSGIVANVLKLLVARVRPHHCDFIANDRGIHTFLDWFPLGANSSWEQSFPSAHMATAAGFAIVLAAFYPRGRWLFPAIAALAGAERVIHQAHFASDVFFGAAVGCIFAPLCVYGSGLSRFFDRIEELLIARSETLARARSLRRRTIPTPHAGIKPAA